MEEFFWGNIIRKNAALMAPAALSMLLFEYIGSCCFGAARHFCMLFCDVFACLLITLYITLLSQTACQKLLPEKYESESLFEFTEKSAELFRLFGVISAAAKTVFFILSCVSFSAEYTYIHVAVITAEFFASRYYYLRVFEQTQLNALGRMLNSFCEQTDGLIADYNKQLRLAANEKKELLGLMRFFCQPMFFTEWAPPERSCPLDCFLNGFAGIERRVREDVMNGASRIKLNTHAHDEGIEAIKKLCRKNRESGN